MSVDTDVTMYPVIYDVPKAENVGRFLQNQSGSTANAEAALWADIPYGVTSGLTADQVTSATPTGTTSATAVMAGLGATLSLTPAKSTRVRLVISGQMSNSTINDGVTLDARYGTGTAPANGDAVTGTLAGIAQTATSLVALQRSGFCLQAIITGLTIGTAYWFDFSELAVTGGTAAAFGVTANVYEF